MAIVFDPRGRPITKSTDPEQVKKAIQRKRERERPKPKPIVEPEPTPEIEEEPKDLPTDRYPSLFESELWAEQTQETIETYQLPLLGIIPPEQPKWGIPEGGTATLEQLAEVDRPREGIIPIGVPPDQEKALSLLEFHLHRKKYRGNVKVQLPELSILAGKELKN